MEHDGEHTEREYDVDETEHEKLPPNHVVDKADADNGAHRVEPRHRYRLLELLYLTICLLERVYPTQDHLGFLCPPLPVEPSGRFVFLRKLADTLPLHY
jgi:hypothetical protein